jgi:hypothetical protein
MQGLCALCCYDVIQSRWFAVMIGADDEHELPDGTQRDVLQDMASGEWGVNEIKIDEGEIKRMAAVAFVAGTAVCSDHIGVALKAADLR